ncbi:hypothetical protein GC176_20750 [bacterium]|nr:hypothetical protein [bacterium]
MQSLVAEWILSLAVVVTSATATFAQDSVTFRYRFEPGEKLTYDISNSVKQTQNVNGQAVKSEFAVHTRVEREVSQIDGDGNIVLTSRNQKLTAMMQVGPLGKYEYSSEKTDNDESSTLGAAATPLYDAIRNAVVKVTLTPQGEVLAVSGLQEALADVLKSNALTAQLAGGANSKDGARASYGEHFLQFPEKAVEPGDTWELPLELTIPQVGKVTGTTKCRYEGTEVVDGRTLQRITSTSEVTVDVDIRQDGVTASGKIEMTKSAGVNRFDLATGRLISRENETTTSGDLIVIAGGQTLPIRQTQTQKHTIRLIENSSASPR